MLEINEGYEIIAAEDVSFMLPERRERVVLGRMETRFGTQWVTWLSSVNPDGEVRYDWGRYFSSEAEARVNYHERIAEYWRSMAL